MRVKRKGIKSLLTDIDLDRCGKHDQAVQVKLSQNRLWLTVTVDLDDKYNKMGWNKTLAVDFS